MSSALGGSSSGYVGDGHVGTRTVGFPRGAVLRAVSAADGKRLAQVKLASPPVLDGMAAAGGRLYLAATDGSVLCLARRD